MNTSNLSDAVIRLKSDNGKPVVNGREIHHRAHEAGCMVDYPSEETTIIITGPDKNIQKFIDANDRDIVRVMHRRFQTSS